MLLYKIETLFVGLRIYQGMEIRLIKHMAKETNIILKQPKLIFCQVFHGLLFIFYSLMCGSG